MVHEFVSGRAWPRERTGSQGTGEALDPRRRARSADLETLLVSRGRQVVIARGPMTTIDEVYCFGRLFSTCDVCISDVRMALGDAGQEIIKTVPRRGYLLAPLERHRRPAAKVRRVPRPAIPNRPSIAVLPFASLGSDPDQDYFADGMHCPASAGSSLSPASSSFPYNGSAVVVAQVGRELGVRYVVEGSVRMVGTYFGHTRSQSAKGHVLGHV